MIVFYAVILALVLYKIKFPVKKNTSVYDGVMFTDYMSIEKTTSIKGIFILIVFVSHASSYLELGSSIFDTAFNILNFNVIGQSMVVPFMLFSGYGVMFSIDKKGGGYIKSIPKNRILKTLLHFDIVVLIYAVLQFIVKDEAFDISLKQVLTALTGWVSIGNSNWYIFAILIMYLLTFVSFSIFKKNKYMALGLNLVLICLYIIIMHRLKETLWYDTVLCYFAGMIFYATQPLFEKIVRSGKAVYWLLLVAVSVLLLLGIKFRMNLYILIIKHILFAGAVVLITMKFGINNKILNFCGKHLFSIYILQRLPMIVFSKLGIGNKYIFVILSFAVTVLLCIGFDKVMSIIDGKLFRKKTA